MILKFTCEQSKFLNDELSLKIEPNKGYDFEKTNLEKILSHCMDTEAEEADEADENGENISQRGKVAADLCDLIMKVHRKWANDMAILK